MLDSLINQFIDEYPQNYTLQKNKILDETLFTIIPYYFTASLCLLVETPPCWRPLLTPH